LSDSDGQRELSKEVIFLTFVFMKPRSENQGKGVANRLIKSQSLSRKSLLFCLPIFAEKPGIFKIELPRVVVKGK